jgi:hypothetical protein
MNRRSVLGITVAAGAAGAAFAGRRPLAAALGRLAGVAVAPPPRQWPFDRAELRALMDRTIDEQRAIVEQAEREDERARAREFLAYYERRRAAAVGG